MSLIYAIVDDENKPFYVGKTKNLLQRKGGHLTKVRNGCKLHLYNKLRKLIRNGKEFDFTILENGIPEQLIDVRECWHIADLRRRGFKLCNMTNGGEGGKGMSAEMQARAAAKRVGQKRSEETKNRMSLAKKGKKFTSEHKKHLSESRKKRVTTMETRLKCSNTSKGNINIKVFEITDPQGNVYVTDHGLTSFCEQHGLTTANLHKVVTGERNHHRGWKAKEIRISDLQP